MLTFTSDQWIILALVFLLGLLVGVFLTSGGRKKWKTRYRTEVERREALERTHADRQREWDAREKEWRSRDTARDPAVTDRDPEVRRP
jgi:hypothetical protein